MYYYFIFIILTYRTSCVIDDGDTALLIGGSKPGVRYFGTVQRYDFSGWRENLVSLNLARSSLACGKYQNSNGKKVKATLICCTLDMLIVDMIEARFTW